MSRGLGRMQCLILDAVEDGAWRSEPLRWRGGEVMPSGTVYYVSNGRGDAELPEDAIDVRGVAAYLLHRLHGRERQFLGVRILSVSHLSEKQRASFHASYSRAIKGLFERGYLDPGNTLGRRPRFCKLVKRYEQGINAYDTSA